MTAPTDTERVAVDRPCIGCGHLTNPTVTGSLCGGCWERLDAGQLIDLASPAATSDPVMWRRAAAHPALPEPLARALAWIEDLDTLAALAANPATPDEVLDLLADHPRPAVAAVAAATRTNRRQALGPVIDEPHASPPNETPRPERRVRALWGLVQSAAARFPVLTGIATTGVLLLALAAVIRVAGGGDASVVTEATTTTTAAPSTTVTTVADPPAPATTAPAEPEVIEAWEGVTGTSQRPTSVWGCAPGPATVALEQASAPVYVWVEGVTTGDATAGTEQRIDHPGGSIDVEVYAEDPTLFAVEVTCIPAPEDG